MTKFNRIFILALDGLEYDLVVKYRLKPLMQNIYGFIDVSYFKNVLTPTIWTSFITGKNPEEHSIYSWWRFSRYKWLDRLAHWVRYNVPIIRSMSSAKIKRILRVLGLTPYPPSKSDLNVPTIFELVKPSIALFVPGYNEEPWIRDLYSEAFARGIRESERVLWKIHKYRRQRLFQELSINVHQWKLFMVWFDLADWMGHLYMGRSTLKILKTYFQLAKLASKIQETLPKNTLLMIVSDHGMEPNGEHSLKAFYSFNININWRPTRITDYFYFITKNLKHII